MAISLAIRLVKADDLTIITDSKVAMSLLADLPKLAMTGFIGVSYPSETIHLYDSVKNHGGIIRVTWVKGHSGVMGNEKADKLASRALTSPDIIIEGSQAGVQDLFLSGRTLKELTAWVDSSLPWVKEARYLRYNRLTSQTKQSWDKSPPLKNVAKSIWTGLRNPQETEFLWKWFWGLLLEGSILLEDLRCPWCPRTPPTLEHIIWECGPSPWRTAVHSSDFMDIGPGIDWDLIPLLPKLAPLRDRQTLEETERQEKMILLAKSGNEMLSEKIISSERRDSRWGQVLRNRLKVLQAFWSKRRSDLAKVAKSAAKVVK